MRQYSLTAVTVGIFTLFLILIAPNKIVSAQEKVNSGVYDDAKILAGYIEEYLDESKETILGRINDDATNFYQISAAIHVFKDKFSKTIVGHDKILLEQALLRRISRSNSPFVEVEVLHTLCLLNRYKYFEAMVPALILKLDHYNPTVNEMAENAINNIIANGNNNTREARIIFSTLRKMFFLSRNTLKHTTEPDSRLERKLKILRWSIKVLGAQELKRLPKEILHLL